MAEISGIYSIIHNESGRTYIGSSKHIKKRLSTHKTDLKYNRHPNAALQNYYNKYGLSSFTFEIVSLIEDISTLIDKENEYIIEYRLADPVTDKFNYELSFNTQWAGKTGAVDPSKYKRGTEHHLYGKPSHNKGKVFSEEVRKNMSLGQKGKTVWNKGIPNSPLTNSRVSESKKGIPWSHARRNAQKSTE